MWTIIKEKIRAFLIDLLKDKLCDDPQPYKLAKPLPGKQPKAPDEVEPPKDDELPRLTTHWRVTGTAEVTYGITGLPHKGGVGRCFLEIDRTVVISAGSALGDVRGYVIEQARKAEQEKLGNQNMIFGRWYNLPVVTFIKKENAK